MLRGILPQPNSDYLCYVDSEGDGGGGGGEPKPDPPKSDGMSKDDVNQLVKGRVEETRKKTQQEVADQLGVSIDEAKQIIADARARSDAEKTEAQKAREAADREKADAETAKSEVAKERHALKVERHLLRALPKDLDPDETDKRASKLARLIDVEVGAEDDVIKAAVDVLKKEWPELFPAGEDDGKPKSKAPNSDPKGTPPPKKPEGNAYERGAERAKARAGVQEYSFLDTASK